jgi:hypothetical protein
VQKPSWHRHAAIGVFRKLFSLLSEADKSFPDAWIWNMPVASLLNVGEIRLFYAFWLLFAAIPVIGSAVVSHPLNSPHMRH